MFTRRSVLAIAGVTLTLAAASAMALDKEAKDSTSKVKLGEKVAEFTGVDADGNEHKLSDYKDNILVLEWINPECPFCIKVYEDGRVKKTVEALAKIDKNIKYITVNSTAKHGPEVSKQWMEKNDLADTITLIDQDGTIGHMFDARTTPHVFVIDGEGVLRYEGAFDNDANGRLTKDGGEVTNYVINAVTQIKAGETVSPDHVKSWGCSVKYAQGKSADNTNRGDKPGRPDRGGKPASRD